MNKEDNIWVRRNTKISDIWILRLSTRKRKMQNKRERYEKNCFHRGLAIKIFSDILRFLKKEAKENPDFEKRLDIIVASRISVVSQNVKPTTKGQKAGQRLDEVALQKDLWACELENVSSFLDSLENRELSCLLASFGLRSLGGKSRETMKSRIIGVFTERKDHGKTFLE